MSDQKSSSGLVESDDLGKGGKGSRSGQRMCPLHSLHSVVSRTGALRRIIDMLSSLRCRLSKCRVFSMTDARFSGNVLRLFADPIGFDRHSPGRSRVHKSRSYFFQFLPVGKSPKRFTADCRWKKIQIPTDCRVSGLKFGRVLDSRFVAGTICTEISTSDW